MGFSRQFMGLVALATTTLGQTTKRYCDSATSICYSGWTDGNGVTIGVALPSVKAAPFDTVVQIISPIANGWVGFSWGGTMPYVPLTLGWVNTAANTTIYSSRMALGLSLPQPYLDAEYTYLKGTGYNKTHWTLNARCRGCSQWLDVDGKVASIDPSSTAVKFAHALSSKAPKEPANNKTTFNVHSSFGHWTLDLSLGQNSNFNQLVAANLAVVTPPASSAPATAIPTSARPTTLVTTVIPTSSPGPIQTGIPTTCSGVPALHFPVLTAPGWRAVKVAGGLTQPRGVTFDTAGNLLVIQNGLGVAAYKVGSDGCLRAAKTVVTARNLNHGIVVSKDGKTLYASSATTVYAWDYDSTTQTVGATSRSVITGMNSKGHVTRTLAFPPRYPNLLIVSHGSNDNFDYEAGSIKTARSCVKVFDISKAPTDGYSYVTGGYSLGYGLRNQVGLTFDADGMVWGVENASDEITRTIANKVIDIHTDNPADELNYLGDPSKPNEQWYGYPTCYTVWRPDAITDRAFAIGDQFVLSPNGTFGDDKCKTTSKPATLAFQAHSAPLDAVFDKEFKSLYVTLHGSSDRNVSIGYMVVEVPFAKTGANGTGFGPAALPSSGDGYKSVLWNPEVEHCSTTQCFRPVSIAKDKYERMFITSDSGSEGEMIMLGKV